MQLTKTIREIESIGTKLSIGFKKHSRSSEEIFKNLPPERQALIQKNLEIYHEIILPENTQGTPLYDKQADLRCFRRALSAFDLKIKSDDFLMRLDDGDILEIYGLDMIQLYRNFNFFKTCGYSILDLAVHEWYHLWERPAQIATLMNQRFGEILQRPEETTPALIPSHIVRETHHADATMPAPETRAMVVDFKNVTGVFSFNDHLAGIAVTCRCQVIASGSEARKIIFV